MSETAVHRTVKIYDTFELTRHAWERMGARGIAPEAVNKTLSFGRVTHVRGATIYAVGRKEITHYNTQGIDLNGLNGIQVVCSESGSVITVYRNRDFRGMRPRSREPRYSRS